MSTQPDPKREHPSTYVVSDRSNEEERRGKLLKFHPTAICNVVTLL